MLWALWVIVRTSTIAGKLNRTRWFSSVFPCVEGTFKIRVNICVFSWIFKFYLVSHLFEISFCCQTSSPHTFKRFSSKTLRTEAKHLFAWLWYKIVWAKVSTHRIIQNKRIWKKLQTVCLFNNQLFMKDK